MKRNHAVFTVCTAAFIAAAAILAGPLHPARAELPVQQLSGGVTTLAPMLEKAMPAVVNVAASAKVDTEEAQDAPDPFQDPFFNDPMFRRFFHDFQFPQGGDQGDDNGQGQQQQPQPRRAPPPRQHEVQGIGSGVIFDARNGYILTNHHVIKNADKVYVITADKRRLDATVVGSDPETDIAVLKVKASGLSELPLGDSDGLKIGDFVVAIGNPFGLSHTVTSGIVSALGRSGLGIEGYEDFIQTDAAINPGNSGGALVDLKGELIGINTAIFSRSGGSMGIGFAIPVNMAKSVATQIIDKGEVRRGKIGIQIQDITPDIATALDMDVLKGALVADVIKGSPAERAGVRQGDIITRFNGADVDSASDLKNKVGMTPLGASVKIEGLRSGKPVSFAIKVEKFDFGGDSGEQSEAKDVTLLKGAAFSAIQSGNPLFGKVEGVEVRSVDPDSPAARAGLRAGDIVTSVNQEPVKTLDQLTAAAKKKDKGILLNIRREDGALFIAIN